MSLATLAPRNVAPVPTESPWTLDALGLPAVAFVVYGAPGAQGSKAFKGMRENKTTGKKTAVLVEQSKKVKPWRDLVAATAKAATLSGFTRGWTLLDGPLVADMVFTFPLPSRFPRDDQRREHGQVTTVPDTSKLLRAAEDALTGIVWSDDSRVIAYRRAEKVYVGTFDPDALGAPGAVIRVWRAPQSVIDARKGLL